MISSDHVVIHVDWMTCRIEGPAPGVEIDKATSLRNKSLARWLHGKIDVFGNEDLEWFYFQPRKLQKTIRESAKARHNRGSSFIGILRSFRDLRGNRDRYDTTLHQSQMGTHNPIRQTGAQQEAAEEQEARRKAAENRVIEKVHLYSVAHQTFPFGLLPIVTKTLEDAGCSWEIKEEFELPEQDERLQNLKLTLDPWDHQTNALKMAEDSRYGMMEIATGGGKSLVMAMLIARNAVRTLVMVNTVDLMYQTRDFLRDYLRTSSGDPIDLGIIGDGQKRIAPVTVAIVNSAYQCAEELSTAGFSQLLVDEGHHAATKTYFAVIQKIAPYWSYCLTGTAFRNSPSEQVALKASFNDVIYKVTTPELQALKILAPLKLELLDNNTEHDPTFLWPQLVKSGIVSCPERNVMLARRITELAEEGNTVLVMVDQVAHGQNLCAAMRMYGFHDFLQVYADQSITPKSVRRTALDKIRNREVSVLVGTIYSEGVNIPTLNVVVNAAAMKSPLAVFQRTGRAVRMGEGKDFGLVLDVWDSGHRILEDHSRKRLNHLRDAGVPIPEELQDRLEVEKADVDSGSEIPEDELKRLQEAVERRKAKDRDRRSRESEKNDGSVS